MKNADLTYLPIFASNNLRTALPASCSTVWNSTLFLLEPGTTERERVSCSLVCNVFAGESRIKNRIRNNLRFQNKKGEMVKIMKQDKKISLQGGTLHAPLTYLTGNTNWYANKLNNPSGLTAFIFNDKRGKQRNVVIRKRGRNRKSAVKRARKYIQGKVTCKVTTGFDDSLFTSV